MEQLPLTPPAGDPSRVPDQAELPLGDTDERPVPFALTARARRTVAPGELPALRVVAPATGGPAEARPDVEEEAGDTRPARARALRRAGARPAVIAEQLGVDPLLVRAWTDGVRGVAHVTAVSTGDLDRSAATEDAVRRAAFASARTTARQQARARLVVEPDLAAGAGVLAATAEVAPDGVTITTRDERVAATVVRWTAHALAVDPDRWRVVVRLGERAAGDLARHRWSGAVGLAPERVRTTRWAGTAEVDAEEARLRLPDPVLAATIAGWCDAVLDDPDDVAF